MKNLIDRWTSTERRAAAILAAAGALGLLVLLFTLVQERPAASRLAGRLADIQGDYRRMSPAWARTKADRELWREAAQDMDELKRTRFYSDVKGFQDLRPDLQALFDASGIAVGDMVYGYTDYPREGLRRGTVEFTFNGSYASLKSFLDRVERQPKFLFVEKIDFQNIGLQPGMLELKITMAGYYER
jgi:hypothetical protein